VLEQNLDSYRQRVVQISDVLGVDMHMRLAGITRVADRGHHIARDYRLPLLHQDRSVLTMRQEYKPTVCLDDDVISSSVVARISGLLWSDIVQSIKYGDDGAA